MGQFKLRFPQIHSMGDAGELLMGRFGRELLRGLQHHYQPRNLYHCLWRGWVGGQFHRSLAAHDGESVLDVYGVYVSFLGY